MSVLELDPEPPENWSLFQNQTLNCQMFKSVLEPYPEPPENLNQF